MRRRRSLLLRLVVAAVFAFVLSWTANAVAGVERFAVIIGNNKGDAGETELRYAESDAQKIHDTLRDLGGFAPANMVLLRGDGAPAVLRTLLTVNDRVRAAVGSPDAQAVLVVYYSGHADATSLHLGGTRFELSQLEQIVRGSAATFRVLVSDACRSGALTRVKGGDPAPAFAIRTEERLNGEGVVFLTASAANEDAQESDELKGSFFTHGFTSGLLGAADSDGDGRVTLDEAYRYAHDATVRSTSRTLVGVQHPTYRYELRGQGKVTLTEPRAHATSRATLVFPEDRTYVVMQTSDGGAVVGEVAAVSRSRRLSVRPGRYFVRGRAKDHLLEGEIDAGGGGELNVRDDALKKVAYARLVRKGVNGTNEGEKSLAHGPVAGYTFRTRIENASTPCHGAFAGWDLTFATIAFTPRVAYCGSGLANETLSGTVDELLAEGRAAHAWDVGQRVTIDVGVAPGAGFFRQRFRTLGNAPSRETGMFTLAASVSLAWDFGAGFRSFVEGGAQTYFYRLERDSADSTSPSFALRMHAGVGKHW